MTKEEFSRNMNELKSDIEAVTQTIDTLKRRIYKVLDEMNRNDNYESYKYLDDIYSSLSEVRLSLPYVIYIESLEHADRMYKE